ncbi:hypothetical protein EAH87_02965 [Sphingomonas koreensis]|nr:hypothetical protein EAH87_02965 [Sphingomonas koreensis]
MNLLLLLYAMIAGLAGINAGPSGVARMAAVADGGAVAAEAQAAAPQAGIALQALVQRRALTSLSPIATLIDARRIAIDSPALPPVSRGRATPERRRE